MTLRGLMLAMAGTALVASPVMAAPANPAASLSVAKAVRSGTGTGKKNELAGGGIFIAVITLVVVIVGVVLVTNDDTDSN